MIWDSVLENVTGLLLDVTGSGATHASVATNTGPAVPRGLYAFEGNVTDSSGNGNNGTNYGATFVTGTIGSQAASFNGSTQYVAVPRSIGSASFSIACWVKTSTANYGSGQWYNGKAIIDGRVPTTTNDFGTSVLAGKYAFGVGNPNTTISSTVSINNGVWHHVAATRDSTTGQMRVYVDGVLSNSAATGPTGAKTAPSLLRIGGKLSGGSSYFLNGQIDDARLYDYVLSASEVAALYTH